jgi:hypothetical protein
MALTFFFCPSLFRFVRAYTPTCLMLAARSGDSDLGIGTAPEGRGRAGRKRDGGLGEEENGRVSFLAFVSFPCSRFLLCSFSLSLFFPPALADPSSFSSRNSKTVTFQGCFFAGSSRRTGLRATNETWHLQGYPVHYHFFILWSCAEGQTRASQVLVSLRFFSLPHSLLYFFLFLHSM